MIDPDLIAWARLVAGALAAAVGFVGAGLVTAAIVLRLFGFSVIALLGDDG